MTWLRSEEAAPLGDGRHHPAGSVDDAELAQAAAGYKRGIASRYKALSREDLAKYTPHGPLHVSPKIDGECWFLVLGEGEPVLINPVGRAISGAVPLLSEAAKLTGRTLVAGELFALRREGRPRVGDVATLLSGGAGSQVARLGFAPFDLLQGGDAAQPQPAAEYADRLAVLERLFDGGKRCRVVKTEVIEGVQAVERRFAEWVDGGKAEGLVARTADGRIYKVKETTTIDFAVVGYTVRSDAPDQARSLLLALMREDGQLQISGQVGNLGTDDQRRELLASLSQKPVDSRFRYAARSGALYQFVVPELVVEVKVYDLMSEDSSGRPVPRMVLSFDPEDGYAPTRPVPGVSLLFPILERVRDDKTVNPTDVRVGQILERVHLPQLDRHVETVVRPDSEVLRRQVWTKTTKGQLAVRKLVVFKTNKDDVDPSWPAYVVHWTDYSPGRKEPLQRTVKVAPNLELAELEAEALVQKGVKRGWVEA